MRRGRSSVALFRLRPCANSRSAAIAVYQAHNRPPLVENPAWYYPFCALVRGGKNSTDPPSQHAMLFAYFDDSSDSRREKYFACGGLIGGDNQWFTFDVRWLNATQ